MPKPLLWRWLSRALLDWTVVVACFATAYWMANPLTWLVCIVVIGTRQHALGILGHDGAHRLACRNRFLNDALTGLLCMWPLGIPLGGYRRFHFQHHRTAGTDDDPEMIHKRALPDWDLPLRRGKIVKDILLDFCGRSLPHVGMAMYLTRAVSVRDALGPACLIGGVAVLSWYLGFWWIPVLWFVSMGTAFWASFRMRLWSEHVGADHTHRLYAPLWARFFFLPHNTWHHWEHHEYPAVPCWALPSLRDSDACVITITQLFRELSRLPQGGKLAAEDGAGTHPPMVAWGDEQEANLMSQIHDKHPIAQMPGEARPQCNEYR